MAGYQHSTQECSFTKLDSALLRAAREYFQAHQLGSPETQVLRCVETFSTKKPGGWLDAWLDPGADQTFKAAILLTATHLVWGRSGERTGVHFVGAQLINIRARAHVGLFSKGGGLDVSGFFEGSRVRLRGTIALGPQEAAQKFCDAVQQAVEKVNPEPAAWPAWMGRRR